MKEKKCKCEPKGCRKPQDRYCGDTLECIGVEKGDTFSEALVKINEVICDGDCDCPDCSTLEGSFSNYGEYRTLKLTVEGGSGEYTYDWDFSQNTIMRQCFDPDEDIESIDGNIVIGSFSNILSCEGNLLVKTTVTDTITGCKKDFYYNFAGNGFNCNLEIEFNQKAEDIEATVTGGSGNYNYTWTYDQTTSPYDTVSLTNDNTNEVHLNFGNGYFDVNLNLLVEDTLSGCSVYKNFLYKEGRFVYYRDDLTLEVIGTSPSVEYESSFDMFPTNVKTNILVEGHYEVFFRGNLSLAGNTSLTAAVYVNNVAYSNPKRSIGQNLSSENIKQDLTVFKSYIHLNVGDIVGICVSGDVGLVLNSGSLRDPVFKLTRLM